MAPGFPIDLQPDDLFHTLPAASQDRVSKLLANDEWVEDDELGRIANTLTRDEKYAYDEIEFRRSRAARRKREAQQERELEEKRQARLADPNAPPEPKRGTQDW